MKVLIVTIMIGVFIMILLTVLCSGCDLYEIINRIIFPGTKVYTKHLEVAPTFYSDKPETWTHITIASVRKRIERYLDVHPNCDPIFAKYMKNLTIAKGMNKEQVICVVGQPQKKKILSSNHELWIYKENNKDELPWYYKWAKLTFELDKLIDIEVQYIHIPK